MSIATLITGGFGSFGSIPHVILDGYDQSEAVQVVQVLAMRIDAHVIANAWFDPQIAGGLFADDMLTSGVAAGGVFILIIGRGPGMTLAGSGGLVS